MENECLTLITPPSDVQLLSWLSEIYGKPVRIERRQLLRHRDLSFVQRIWVADGLPGSLIYKVVLPPWDVEQELHSHVLIPSICNSARLYMAAHLGQLTVMFLEDLGDCTVKQFPSTEIAWQVGRALARMHRSYSYRTDELIASGALPTLFPSGYEDYGSRLAGSIRHWKLIDQRQADGIVAAAGGLGTILADEPVSLVHGDFYAENLIARAGTVFVVDWSWFTLIGVSVMDLATVTMEHVKNGSFTQFSNDVFDAYCFESGRSRDVITAIVRPARLLSRLLFLGWLVERRSRGILGTTVGPVDELIPKVVGELDVEVSST